MNVNISRRKLLTTAALGGIALAGAACSTAQIAQFEAEWANVAGLIQSAVSKAAAYVPTVESIAETAASLFGPAYVTLVTAGSAAFNALVQTLINVVGQLNPPAQTSLRRRLMTSSPNVPIVIGKTPAGVQVNGWRA